MLDVLEQTLAFEGDTHQCVLPEAHVLWLDRTRGRDNPAIREYAERRLNAYRSFLEGARFPVFAEAAVQLLSSTARKWADPPIRGSQRDLDFAAKIMDTLAVSGSGWAAVVVGANHTADVECSMRLVLEDHGYRCDVTVL